MNTSKKKILSLVFSFRNEEDNIPELIKRVEAVLSKVNYEYELIFVNDASTDKSLEILEKSRLTNKKIKNINMSRNFGISASVIAGFSHTSGDAIIYMDSDLQDPPEIIPKLISKWEEGYDVIHTVRTKRKGENFFRMFLVKIAYEVIDALSEKKILQNSGNFKLISRRALNAILKLNEHDPFLRGLSSWVGFRQTHILYEREARYAGKTHFSLLNNLGLFKEFVAGITFYSSMPLYFSLIIGFLVSFGAFVYLAYIIFIEIFLQIDNTGWPSLMVTMLFLGGSILFAIGIMGIYLGKMHEAMKQRPRYLIESTKGFSNNETNNE